MSVSGIAVLNQVEEIEQTPILKDPLVNSETYDTEDAFTFPFVDAGQANCYDESGIINLATEGEAF